MHHTVAMIGSISNKQEHFEQTFEQLRCVLDQGQKLNRKLFVGGDFNLQLGVGVRGEEFQNVVEGFGLLTTNASDTPWENQWTFESTMGDRRTLDYIMVSRSFQFNCSSASNQLNLESDHRAVKSIIVPGGSTHVRTRKEKSMKGWMPKMDVQGNPSEYQTVLDASLRENLPQTFDDMDVILRDAGTMSGASI